ncbi:MAG: hypothetical protein WC792_02695 [Candidatus Micrarchaeia archaeon]
MARLDALKRVLSNPRFAVFAAMVSSIALAAYAVFSNTFVWGTLEANPLGPDPVTVGLLAALALGTGLLASSLAYSGGNLEKKACAAGVGGSGLGLLSSACPYCPPVLAYLFGAQGLFALSAYGSAMALVSVALVYYGLYDVLGKVEKSGN